MQTTAGRELGRIEDFFFDGDSGTVEGFELIGGLNEQQSSESAFPPAHPGFESGKDYTFIDASAAETIENLATALRNRRR